MYIDETSEHPTLYKEVLLKKVPQFTKEIQAQKSFRQPSERAWCTSP